MRFAVLGAGNGGHAIAADLSLAGERVNLFNRSPGPIEAIHERGGIKISGAARTGFAQLANVTNNIEEAVQGADVIMVVVPAFAHKSLIEQIASHLEDGQIVVFNPGYFGSIQLYNYLKKRRIKKEIILVETSSLIFSCRLTGPAMVRVNGVKNVLQASALPARDTPEALNMLKRIYPQFVPATNALEVNLNNLNFISHPAISLLNAGRIESTQGNFLFYWEGVTPSVGKVVGAVDRERLRIVEALGYERISWIEWMRKWYGTKGQSEYEVFVKCSKYKRSKAPNTLWSRYLTEDVPYGMVPVASLGDQLGISIPIVKGIIKLASTVHQIDYMHEGLTTDMIGLRGLSAEEINSKLS